MFGHPEEVHFPKMGRVFAVEVHVCTNAVSTCVSTGPYFHKESLKRLRTLEFFLAYIDERIPFLKGFGCGLYSPEETTRNSEFPFVFGFFTISSWFV